MYCKIVCFPRCSKITNTVRGKINQVQKNDSSLIGLTLTHKFNLLPPIPYYSKGNRFMLKYN